MSAASRGSILAGLIVAALASALFAAPAQASVNTPCVIQPGVACMATQQTPLPRISVVGNDGLRLSWDNAPFSGIASLRWAGNQKQISFKHTQDLDTYITGVPNVSGLQVQFTDTQHALLPSRWSKTLNELLPATAHAPKLTVNDLKANGRSFRLSFAPTASNGSAKIQHYEISMQHRSRTSITKKVTGWHNWSNVFGGKGESTFSDSYIGIKAKPTRMAATFWSVRNYGSAGQITRYQYRVRIRACSGTANNGYYALCGAWSSWSNTVLVAHGKLK